MTFTRATEPSVADVQARRPTVQVSLSRAGVTDVEKVIRLRQNGSEQLFSARFECVIGVTAQGMTACPCAQELVIGHARERLERDGFTEREIERILAAVPVATHNQRGLGTLHIGCTELCEDEIEAATLLEIVEGAMS